MRFSRYPRLSRILVLLAVFQMVAPSVAAIADAWRLDRREAYVHIEAESSASCVMVHAHNCVLCSIATEPTGIHPPTACAPISRAAIYPAPATALRSARWWPSFASSPRAPPALQG
ncbi:MAG: hypothetical protein ABMA00_08070 [Gemmatimonas sp.]